MFGSQRSFVLALVTLGSFVAGNPPLLAQAVTLPELPEVNGPFALSAVTDTNSGKSHFRYNGSEVPPTIRVQTGPGPPRGVHQRLIARIDREVRDDAVH